MQAAIVLLCVKPEMGFSTLCAQPLEESDESNDDFPQINGQMFEHIHDFSETPRDS